MATKKVKETVENVKNEAVEAAKKISKAAEPAVEAAKTTAKAAGSAAKSAAKSAGKKIAAALIPEVYVEYGESKADCAELVERCKADFKAKHKTAAIRSCKLYIKPEDAMVYYVINEIEDKISL